MSYKIAAVTEDNQKLSSHFGMAPAYRVFTVEDGQVLSEETRSKPHHEHHPQGNHEGHAGGHGHEDMFAPIADCKVLLCGGMGTPAYQKALSAGLEVVLTGGEIQAAVQAYLNGQTASDLRRVHQH
jgi:predicted Fe-Mo cluster-binding NifX family protein